ncbi:MAG: LptF/LptG family permease [Spirochaetales bacterium]|nr:LptF/LptG family permease [Spirochaetales bacterium]
MKLHKGHRVFTLSRYIAREFLISFTVAFLFFFFIFFVNNLLLLIQKEDILSKNVPLLEVLLVVMYRLPIVILLAFPFGTLMGSLMAISRLSSDKEILAMRACGVSTASIFIPFIIMGLLLSFLSFFTNDYLIPVGYLEQEKLGKKMFITNPKLHLEAYSVRPLEKQRILIVTGAVDDEYLYDVVIFDRTDTQDRRIISAKKAHVTIHPEQSDVISLKLEDVFSQVIDAQQHGQFEYSQAGRMEYNLIFKPWSINLSLGPLEMTARDVWQKMETKQKEMDVQEIAKMFRAMEQRYLIGANLRQLSEANTTVASSLNRERSKIENLHTQYITQRDKKLYNSELQKYTLEFHRKFAFPFACIVFVVFTFPLGLLARRSGRIFGFVLGLVASIVYWGLLVVGHEVGFNQQYPPLIAMWTPNIIVFLAGVGILFISRARQ